MRGHVVVVTSVDTLNISFSLLCWFCVGGEVGGLLGGLT
jgi:hypothetical protein